MDYDKYLLAAAARQRAAAAASTSSSKVPPDFEWPPFEDEEFGTGGDEGEGQERYDKELPSHPGGRGGGAHRDDDDWDLPPPPPPPPAPELPSPETVAQELNSSSASFLLHNIIIPLPIHIFYLLLAYIAIFLLAFLFPYFFGSVRWSLTKIGWLIIKLVNGIEWLTRGLIWTSRWLLKITAVLGISGTFGAISLYCYWAPKNPLQKLTYDRIALATSIPTLILLRHTYSLPIPKPILFIFFTLSLVHILSTYTPCTTREILSLPVWLSKNWTQVRTELHRNTEESKRAGMTEEDKMRKVEETWEELMEEKRREVEEGGEGGAMGRRRSSVATMGSGGEEGEEGPKKVGKKKKKKA